MGTMINGVFANAIINITGNMTGWRSAMRETQTQMWGLMTLSNHIGGAIAQNLLSPIAAYRGMGNVYAAQQHAQLAFGGAMQNWRAQRPVRPTPPPSALHLTNPALYAQMMAQFRQQMAAYPGLMGAWQQNRPNRQTFMQQMVQQAAQAEGRMLFFGSVIAGIGRLFVEAAQRASTFIEELNKMTQTFGQSTKDVMGYVEGMAKRGIGRSAMMSSISTMGIEMMGVGINEKLAARMATGLGGRGVDLASQYNLTPENTFRKIQSGIAGFGRPLKELGVIINEDRVETYAFTHGLWDGKAKLTEMTKVLARAGLIMQETARSAGDFERTSGQMANQLRMVAGNWDNLLASLGNTSVISALVALLNKTLEVSGNTVSSLHGPHLGMKTKPSMLEEEEARGARLDEQLVSRRNREAADRAYADEVIAENFMGKGHHASHTGLADFGKKLQEQVFNDTGKQQLDLTRKLIGLNEHQVEYLKRLNFLNLRAGAPTPF